TVVHEVSGYDKPGDAQQHKHIYACIHFERDNRERYIGKKQVSEGRQTQSKGYWKPQEQQYKKSDKKYPDHSFSGLFTFFLMSCSRENRAIASIITRIPEKTTAMLSPRAEDFSLAPMAT